jgi:membrane protein implicated in regulation of membrane protease activity
VAAWLVWAIAALLLAVGEIFTPGLFFLGPIAIGAVAAAFVSLAGPALWLQLLVFAGGAGASLLFLRPIARAHLRMPPALRTGTAALQGAHAVVLQRVDLHGGRIKLGGEEWSARSYVPDQVFEPGAQVEVVEIQGATALVYE